MSSIPGQPPPRAKERGCFMPLLFLMLLGMGAGTFWRFFYEPTAMLIQSRNWKQVPCTVYYPELEKEEAAEKASPAERLNLRYRYGFAGKQYHLRRRIWFFKPDADEIEAIRKKYPAGDYTCFVNPEKPEISTLERDFRPQFLIGIFPLLLALIGLTGLVAYHWPRRRRRREWRFIVPAGRSRKRRRGLRSFLVVAVFAFAYNGVVYFLVREVIESWSAGFPDFHGILLTAFTIPFVALGVGSIGLAVYLLMKLFNPRPQMQLSPATLPLGGNVEISWRFAGRIRRIRRLRIFVEGREEATYARGTKMYTDREVFTTIPLLDTAERAKIPSGQISFTMPVDAVPTFHSPHNNVSWVVRIVGHIRFWPDADDEIELNVVPAAEQFPAEVGA